jgi:hypothetical protein
VDDEVRRADPVSLSAGGLDVWFARAQRGDPAALDGLLRAVFPTARRFAARSCASREDAEDAVQDALTALARRVGALRGRGDGDELAIRDHPPCLSAPGARGDPGPA